MVTEKLGVKEEAEGGGLSEVGLETEEGRGAVRDKA